MRNDKSVSVHAISILYSLRSVRALLDRTVARNWDTLLSSDIEDVERATAMLDLCVRRIEHAADLYPSPAELDEDEAEARLGSDSDDWHH